MDWSKTLILLFSYYHWTFCTETPCIIELKCPECIADNMPLVTSHRTSNGTVVIANGDEVTLSCGVGRFLAYPLSPTLSTRCESGRYKVLADGKLRHLLELGCQENIFEDVLHTVEHCSPPLQGRAYQLQESPQNIRHMATLCFDEDRGITMFAHITGAATNTLRMPPHNDQRTPLTLFGNFNHMFDANTRIAADKLFSDNVRMNRRLRELFKHEKFSFADQMVTDAELLSVRYFDDQNMRVSGFASNKIVVWKSVATGNLEHVHKDVAKFIKMSRPHATLDVYVGTHGVASLRTEHAQREIYLGAGRFPVPKYLWTVVHDRVSKQALAVVVLNDPFVSVSEIRESVFCDSECRHVAWLHELRRHRNYETPLYGLTFCCSVHNFTTVVGEMPKNILADIPNGHDGLLTKLLE